MSSNKKYNFREYNQNQQIYHTILPSQLLPDEHPARVIDKIVETLDLSKIYNDYALEGNPSYHPKMMLKVLFYSYYSSSYSSRKIRARLISGDAAYIFLSGAQAPNHRAINEFRVRHIAALGNIFTQIVIMCEELDLLSFTNWGIDGQKIHANASFKNSYSKERLSKRMDKISVAISKILETEVTESFTYEIKSRRVQKLKKQQIKLNDLAEQFKEINDLKVKINTTDPDAPMMTHKDSSKKPSYNHQSVVDEKCGITVAIETSKNVDVPDDLFLLVDKGIENTGNTPENILADCAFSSLKNLDTIYTSKERTEEFFVPDRKMNIAEEDKKYYGKELFIENKNGEVTCPAQLKMKIIDQVEKENILHTTFKGTDCKNCLLKGKCTKGDARTVSFTSVDGFVKKMRDKLNSTEGREIYRKRQHIVEAGHGDDQKNKGWRQHFLRGYKKVHAEFTLIRIASNIGKIIKYADKGKICAMT